MPGESRCDRDGRGEEEEHRRGSPVTALSQHGHRGERDREERPECPCLAESRLEDFTRQRPCEDLAEAEPGRLDTRQRNPGDRVDCEQQPDDPREPSSASDLEARADRRRRRAPPPRRPREGSARAPRSARLPAQGRPTPIPPPDRAPPRRCRSCLRPARRPSTQTRLGRGASRRRARATPRRTSHPEDRRARRPIQSRPTACRCPRCRRDSPARRTRGRIRDRRDRLVEAEDDRRWGGIEHRPFGRRRSYEARMSERRGRRNQCRHDRRKDGDDAGTLLSRSGDALLLPCSSKTGDVRFPDGRPPNVRRRERREARAGRE